jgi:hypothetical protein
VVKSTRLRRLFAADTSRWMCDREVGTIGGMSIL